MDKPLCRLCHHRHYASEDHVWSEAGASVASPPGDVPKQNITPAPAIAIKSSGKFDRLTYQKLYMRQWRQRKAQAQAAMLSS